MIDYIIVGCGIGGISFIETCIENGKSVVVFDNDSQKSSKIAAGLYNPVILKRFSALKDAQLQIDLLNIFYANIEQKLQVKFDFKLPILRKFFSIEEQNNWFSASDKPNLSPFLSLDLIKTKFKNINAPFDYGEILQTGYIDTEVFLSSYKKYLKSLSVYFNEPFNYQELKNSNDIISYKNLVAKNIVFAEGFGLKNNPYFNELPLDGTKGELFIIKCQTLNLNAVINTSIYIVPLGNSFFKIGATYNWDDKSDMPTSDGKEELLTKIKAILDCNFEIIEHLAAVRPTVKDRKPLIGTHPIYKNIHILNGLGTRGVMLAPQMAQYLFNHIENGTPLDKDIDIKRYLKNL